MPEKNPKSDAEGETFIVITGDPVEGLIFTGPFATHDEAEQWAEGQHEWWTAFLQAPPRNHGTPK